MSFDVLIRGATVVGAGEQRRLDVGVADGLIASLGPELIGPATQEIDAAGLHLLPGVVDAHVHLNEPGRTDWEGFETGTRALAAGGATAAIDMPLNARPPTVTGGGVDDLTLLEGMCRAASLGLPVAVHAESEAITAGLAKRARAAGRTRMRDFLASRPAVAELQAIARAWQRREVRAAAPPARGGRGTMAGARRRHAADGRIRSPAGALGAEERRRRVRRLGRHLGLPDDAVPVAD
jgi:allantoinase